MQVFVISLKNQEKRRAQVEGQLAAAGIPFTFFDAIQGDAGCAKYFSGSAAISCLLEVGRFLTANERGCYASHLTLWRRCVELDEPIVILEDDFLVEPCFEEALRYAEQKIGDFSFIRLEPMEKRWSRKPRLAPVEVASDPDFSLFLQRMPSVRSTAYVLSPKCASIFIDISRKLSAPVDHVVRRSWAHGVPLLAMVPPAITLSEEAEHSSMIDRKKRPVRHLLRPLRLIYRHVERVRAANWAEKMLKQGL